MEQIRIAVRVPLAAALAQGKGTYGKTTVKLSDEAVASLSAPARAFLCEYGPPGENKDEPGLVWARVPPGSPERIDVDVADTEHVLARLEGLAARQAAERAEAEAAAEKRRAFEAEAAALVALDPASATDEQIARAEGLRADLGYLGDAVRDVAHWREDALTLRELAEALDTDTATLALDPLGPEADAAKLEDAPRPWRGGFSRSPGEPGYPALPPALAARWQARTAWDEAREAARKERREKEKAEEAAREKACRDALRALAAGEDDLARAVAEGYDVDGRMLDRLVDRLETAIRASCPDVEMATDSSAWKDPAERSAPSKEAFALLDAVRVAARTENERLPAAVGRWKVSRIVRVDTCAHEGKRLHHYVTAVLATLDTAIDLREVTSSIEPQECPGHGDEDEEE